MKKNEIKILCANLFSTFIHFLSFSFSCGLKLKLVLVYTDDCFKHAEYDRLMSTKHWTTKSHSCAMANENFFSLLLSGHGLRKSKMSTQQSGNNNKTSNKDKQMKTEFDENQTRKWDLESRIVNELKHLMSYIRFNFTEDFEKSSNKTKSMRSWNMYCIKNRKEFYCLC